MANDCQSLANVCHNSPKPATIAKQRHKTTWFSAPAARTATLKLIAAIYRAAANHSGHAGWASLAPPAGAHS
jgi:hypothetical protein